ncbi:MAG: glycosyltransferase family 2 protein [Ardenticatenia bacterium]|nr:glycosyltransferase family 2 protein [Ardenticatenia bacterium]
MSSTGFTPSSSRISVVIPVYNQGRFLASALESVIGQVSSPEEIIVVDDGSTDETPEVALSFGSQVHYIRQDNRGLPCARNVGIANASGDLVAFLDSDDVWMPEHLNVLARAATEYPEGRAWFTGIRYLDDKGQDLPQVIRAQEATYKLDYLQLLRSNSVIPSTVMIRRQVVLALGGFSEDHDLLRGCEDWDLWIRMTRQGYMIGVPSCTVGYRIHGSSASSHIVHTCQAAKRVMEREVGPDDGRMHLWPATRRRGWGGAYRFCAITALVRGGDWQACAEWLGRAFMADSTLIRDEALFYELALGQQPFGYRGSLAQADIDASIPRTTMLLRTIGAHSDLDRTALRMISSSAWQSVARVAYNLGRASIARKALYHLMLSDLRHVANGRVLDLLIRSTVAWPLVRRRRRRRRA